MRDILSTPANMPPSWVSSYAVKGLKYAVKSGTSNKVVIKNGKETSLPRDGWIASFTPSTVTLFWAGNADDKPMNQNAFGINISSELNRSFLSRLLADDYLHQESMPNSDTQSVTISKVTGKIATDTTPEEYKVATIGFNVALPTDTPYVSVSVDNAC